MDTSLPKIGLNAKKKIVDEAREALLKMVQQQAERKKREGIPGPKAKKRPVSCTPERQLRLHELSQDLREVRDRLGISQCELGNRIGIDQTTISNWEIERCIPTVESENKLKKGLKLLHKQLERAELSAEKKRALYKRNRTSNHRERNVYMFQRCTKCMRLTDRPCDKKCPITMKTGG
jgi:transcriptional regulator with XRE-family HTH domain